MSFYSDSNVQTHYIDPKTYLQATHLNQSGRINFELDGNQLAYLPNMRLLNVGVSSNGAHLYNKLLGGYSLIKNIRLMDGNAELCALNEQQLYRGFLNLNKTFTISSSIPLEKINQDNIEIVNNDSISIEFKSMIDSNKMDLIFRPFFYVKIW